MAMTQTISGSLARGRDYDDGELRLIKAWSHEFLHVAMMSAFVSMGCNAAVRARHAIGLNQIEANLPEEPAIYRAIRQGLLELPERYALALLAGQNAYGVLGVAIEAFKIVQATQAKTGDVMQPVLEDLAGMWHRAASSLHQALDVVDDSGLLQSHSTPGTSLEAQCPLRIRQLLMAAASGETVASSGLGEARRGDLPEWVQRRRWVRQNLNMKCFVTVRGSTYDAIVRNISMGGALLDGMPSLVRLTPLAIEIKGGRQLLARVMWSRDQVIGVKFEQQLLYDDPLIDEACA